MGLLDWLADRLETELDPPPHDATHLRFTEEQVARMLPTIRGIVELPEAQAMEQLNLALTQIVNAATPKIMIGTRATSGSDAVDEWALQNAEREINRVEGTVETLRAKVATGNAGAIQSWDADAAERSLASLESYLTDDLRERLQPRLDPLREEIPRLAADARYLGAMNAITEAAEDPIGSVTTAARLRTQLRDAEEMLRRLGRLDRPEAQKLRTARIRVARYRTDKRLDQAAVARAGGNLKKAERMEREAGAMLAQDWPDCFPSEPVPPLAPPARSG